MKVDCNNFNCAGCGACANICPKGAISMLENEEGFYTPHIDESKCIDCGLCEKICPELHNVEKNTKTPDCYAVMANDEIRAKSSSGGAFSVIAHEIFNRGGVVCGAAFDENWTVRHIIIDNENDIDKLRGSKYVQSFISENLYKTLKNYLDENRWVLFTGTPCQVAGFKAFLGKDYTNLLLVDLICSGNPSPKVFEKYKECIIPENDKIVKINFRDKIQNGWSCTHTTTTTTTTTITDNKWMHTFLSKTISCGTCNTCKYASVNRVSDITIADFWGIQNYKKELDDKKGTSIYLANTNKAKDILEIIKNNFSLLESVPLQFAMQPVMKAPYKENSRRPIFFKMIKEKSFYEVYNKLLGVGNNIGIMNFWYVPNRGAILTNYALHEFLKDNNYNPLTLNYYPRHEYNLHRNSFAERFANKYIKKTVFCPDYIALKELNKNIKTFIVGSDQVFRNWCVVPHKDKYFLNFADENSKKIACSASFGYPYFDGDETATQLMKKYLNRFDALSVREITGVDVLKNTFNLDSIQILDPVFWIDKNKYSEIADTSKLTDNDYIAYYVMWDSSEIQNAIKYASQKLGIKAINIKTDQNLEDWLYRIKNAKIIITDSFHATCFSLIFNKPFISIPPGKNDNDVRINDILELVNLPERLVNKPSDIQKQEFLFDDIEYKDSMFTKLNTEVERSKKWLLDAIKTPKIEKEYSADDKLFYAMMDRLNIMQDENVRLSTKNINCINKIKENYLNKSDLKILLNERKYRIKYRIYKILSLSGLKKFKDKTSKYKKFIRVIRELKG